MSRVKPFLLIGLGGFVGANARYLVSTYAARHLGASLPWGTAVVNVLGSFILGAFLTWTTERVVADAAYRWLVVVGFCGSFTTFSSYAFETAELLEQGHVLDAIGNVAVNNIACFLAVVAGIAFARWI